MTLNWPPLSSIVFIVIIIIIIIIIYFLFFIFFIFFLRPPARSLQAKKLIT